MKGQFFPQGIGRPLVPTTLDDSSTQWPPAELCWLSQAPWTSSELNPQLGYQLDAGFTDVWGVQEGKYKACQLDNTHRNTKKVLLIPVKGWPKSSLGVWWHRDHNSICWSTTISEILGAGFPVGFSSCPYIPAKELHAACFVGRGEHKRLSRRFEL